MKSEKHKRRTRCRAAKAPGWLTSAATSTSTPAAARKFKEQQLGTFSAASPVKLIDPAEYLSAREAHDDKV